jgi:hypothetical protein
MYLSATNVPNDSAPEKRCAKRDSTTAATTTSVTQCLPKTSNVKVVVADRDHSDLAAMGGLFHGKLKGRASLDADVKEGFDELDKMLATS